MKKNFLLACLISAVFAAPAGAWELWDQFKATNLTPEGRVVDYSEAKLITTSEGQSYGMFFALVANDKKAFDEMFAWTEKNLGENQPAWLWGIPDGKPNGTGKILDTNNATDSDMWIAYCLIEAARIDGANRWKQILHVTIPGLLPTFILLLIMQIGQLLNCVFDKIYLLQNTLNLQVSEMLPTYVYKTGMISQKYGLATAGGLFNSVISVVLVLIANTISRKVSETSLF